MGRRRAVRRELCVPGQPRPLALHRHHPRREAAQRGGVKLSPAAGQPRRLRCRSGGVLLTNSCAQRVTMSDDAPYLRHRAGRRRFRGCRLPTHPEPKRNPMSRSHLSRLSICAAAIGALAVSAFLAAPSRAAEDAVVIPAPAVDVAPSERHPDRGGGGRLLLGRAGRVPAHRGRRQRRLGLCRRRQGHRLVRDRLDRHHRPRGIRRDQIRPEADQLRQAVADLLLGRPRSDPAEPPGPGLGHAISLGDLHHQRRAEEGGGGLYRPAQRRQGLRQADRHQGRTAGRRFIRPRPIIRTT